MDLGGWSRGEVHGGVGVGDEGSPSIAAMDHDRFDSVRQ
jgi:hypothetical protein